MHIELRWYATRGANRHAVARLFMGADGDLKQVVATIACTPEQMNTLDRMLKEGALDVDDVTYLGRELGPRELDSW